MQLPLRAYQEMLLCQPRAKHLLLEPIRTCGEGKALSPNLGDARGDVSSLTSSAATPLLLGGSSAKNESDELEVSIWNGRLVLAPISDCLRRR